MSQLTHLRTSFLTIFHFILSNCLGKVTLKEGMFVGGESED
jgi:hypothetical protein